LDNSVHQEGNRSSNDVTLNKTIIRVYWHLMFPLRAWPPSSMLAFVRLSAGHAAILGLPVPLVLASTCDYGYLLSSNYCSFFSGGQSF